MSGSNLAFAIPSAPICDPKTGIVTQAWYRVFVSLISRGGGTGGRRTPAQISTQGFSLLSGGVEDVELGTEPSQLLFFPDEKAAPGLPSPVTLGASPYTFQSLGEGYALLSGGWVSSVTWTRDGVTFFSTDQVAGFFPLSSLDSLVITYAVLPTLTFIPR